MLPFFIRIIESTKKVVLLLLGISNFGMDSFKVFVDIMMGVMTIDVGACSYGAPLKIRHVSMCYDMQSVSWRCR